MFVHVNDMSFQNLETVTVRGKRHYVTPQGLVYPSVTTVVSLHNKDVIDNWKKRVGEENAKKISTQASGRGNRLHKV